MGVATKKIYRKTVSVYKNQNQRVFTGLYVNPGEVIKIVHANSYKSLEDVTLRIHMGDDMPYRTMDTLNYFGRYPHIKNIFQITEKQFTLATPHGGFLFFDIDKKSNSALLLTFQIFGAY